MTYSACNNTYSQLGFRKEERCYFDKSARLILLFTAVYMTQDLVYGFIRAKVARPRARVIEFCSTKNLDEQKFKEHLARAPWHVGEIFDDI